MNQSHSRFREGDEWYCPKCRKRWGVDEETPKCESHNRKEYLKYLASKGKK